MSLCSKIVFLQHKCVAIVPGKQMQKCSSLTARSSIWCRIDSERQETASQHSGARKAACQCIHGLMIHCIEAYFGMCKAFIACSI